MIHWRNHQGGGLRKGFSWVSKLTNEFTLFSTQNEPRIQQDRPLPLKHLKMRLKKTASESSAVPPLPQQQQPSMPLFAANPNFCTPPVRLVRPEPKPRRSVDSKSAIAHSPAESFSSSTSNQWNWVFLSLIR